MYRPLWMGHIFSWENMMSKHFQGLCESWHFFSTIPCCFVRIFIKCSLFCYFQQEWWQWGVFVAFCSRVLPRIQSQKLCMSRISDWMILRQFKMYGEDIKRMNPSHSSSPYAIDSCFVSWKVLAGLGCPCWPLGIPNLHQRLDLGEYLLISAGTTGGRTVGYEASWQIKVV